MVHMVILCYSLPYILCSFSSSFFFKYLLFMLEDLDWFIFKFTDSFTSQLKYAWLAPLVDFFFKFQFPNFSISESPFCLPITCLHCFSLSCEYLLLQFSWVLSSFSSFNTSAVFKPLVYLRSGLLYGFCSFCFLNISH